MANLHFRVSLKIFGTKIIHIMHHFISPQFQINLFSKMNVTAAEVFEEKRQKLKNTYKV